MKSIRICVAITLAVLLVSEYASAQERDQQGEHLLFDVAEDHLWNVAYKTLFGNVGSDHSKVLTRNPRTDGDRAARKLLDGDNSAKAIDLLDRLIDAKDIAHAQSPVEQVVMQRGAWKLFDWFAANTDGADATSRKLRVRLAKFMLMIALTEDEITNLPNNYNTKLLNNNAKTEVRAINDLDLPKELFANEGNWLQVTYKSRGRIAVAHEDAHGGRSEFLLFLHFSNAPDVGKPYVRQFNDFAAYAAQRRSLKLRGIPPPANAPVKNFPEFPQGTQAILLQRMMVVTRLGVPRPTSIVESIEFSEFTPTFDRETTRRHRRKFAAFKTSLGHLLRQEKATLRRVVEGEPVFGAGFFPRGLQQCTQCHNGPGLLSFGTVGFSRHSDRPLDVSVKILPNGSPGTTSKWKAGRYEYGLLKGILDSEIEAKVSD